MLQIMILITVITIIGIMTIVKLIIILVINRMTLRRGGDPAGAGELRAPELRRSREFRPWAKLNNQ